MYEKIKELCDSKGITVSEMCKHIGISPSVMSNWKKRNNMPNMKTAQKIADFFNVPLGYFVEIDRDGLNEMAERAAVYLDGAYIQLAKRIEALPADKQQALMQYLAFLEQN